MKTFKPRRRQKADRFILRKSRGVLIITLIIILAAGLIWARSYSSYQTLHNRASWAASLRESPGGEGVNYLLYGVYLDGEESIIDEIFFLNYDPDSAETNIIFIPGNALLHRIDAQADADEPDDGDEPPAEVSLVSFYTPANFYHDGGAEMLVTQVASFLGVPLHHYIEIDYDGLPPLINNSGGMDYHGIKLQGEDYLKYFIEGESGKAPLARSLFRMNILQEFVDFLQEKKGFWATPSLLRKAAPYLDTDLTWKELLEFDQIAEPLLSPETFIAQLPGTQREINGDQYFEPDRDLTALLLANLGEGLLLPPEMITVEVLNGSGARGVAAKMADLLRSSGFSIDDENVGNADNYDYQRSQVISRLEDVSAAKQVAEAVPGSDFIKDPLPGYHVMVTVIVGKDATF